MIARRKILSLLAFSFVFLCTVNFLSIKGLWYYLFWWFDMPMHFIGGGAVVLLLAYVFYNRIYILPRFPILIFFCGALVLYVGWEIFEFVVSSLIGVQLPILIDSLSDIFFDMAGGVTTLLYIIRK